MLFARWQHHIRFGSGFLYENFKVIQNPGFLPEHPQNWITGSLCHSRHSQRISERSVHNFLSYLADTQTNKLWQKHNLFGGGKDQKPTGQKAKTRKSRAEFEIRWSFWVSQTSHNVPKSFQSVEIICNSETDTEMEASPCEVNKGHVHLHPTCRPTFVRLMQISGVFTGRREERRESVRFGAWLASRFRPLIFKVAVLKFEWNKIKSFQLQEGAPYIPPHQG